MKSEDIARLAGVSRSTVSRVVNNYTNVPEATRKKVQSVIDKYGYIPDSAARSLAGKKNQIIGLFLIDNFLQRNEVYSVHDSPYLSEFINYSTDAAENRDYNILISVINKESKYIKLNKLINSNVISGAVIIGGETRKDIIGKIINSDTKFIFVDENLDGEYQNIMHLYSDNYKGAYLATEELIKNGHKKIGHITGNLNKFDARERLRGFKDCLRDYYLKFDEKYLAQGDFGPFSGYEAIKEIYNNSKGDLPTGIFVANDLMSIKVIEFLKQKDIKVPKDISIIGFDNDKFSELLENGLSTVSRPVKELARKSINMLIDFIETGEKEKVQYENVCVNVIRRNTIKNIKK